MHVGKLRSIWNISDNSCPAPDDLSSILYLRTKKHSVHMLPSRDGTARENKLPRKTDKKRKAVKGSRKLEDYCLARMHVQHNQTTERVKVTYICAHTNHSLELEECKYLPLPQSVRKEIQEKFAQGVTLERIMNGINIS